MASAFTKKHREMKARESDGERFKLMLFDNLCVEGG